jgi:glycosyltransferase involved in cell wall biosynthesis
MPPTFSLIVATKGRTEEVVRLFETLSQQTFRDFEVIVSDQNDDDRIEPIIARFRERFPLRHVRSKGGASAARNAGIPLALGTFITFPDDDSWYPPDLLATMRRLFTEHPDWDIISCRSRDENLQDPEFRWLPEESRVNRRNVWRAAIEYTVFAKTAALRDVGPFDQTIGVGSAGPWQSGEITDLLLRALAKGYVIYYSPASYVCHPRKRVGFTRNAGERNVRYAMGTGRVMRKHGYSLWEGYPIILKPICASAAFLLIGRLERSLFYFRVFKGRWSGWLDGGEAT